ncbi:DMT family transporter [Cloacibacillus sp. An23]|uniref:DMT family transporter n=1 Tax=Cloacibacillus sp. An23 TaxID=1965591 RepID=UPI000B38B2F4|nr:DMT family transporter [Cloacibacillus sp. An23]OUO94384.1 hypothetical protein B5F39_03930 [Cloacibacillus sp. An23]
MDGGRARGVLMALGTAFAWGGTGSFAKLIAAGGVSQLTVVCYRGLFAAAAVGAFMLARRGAAFFRCGRAELAQYAALGVFTVLFNATGYMMSCVYLSVPQVLMLNYTFPIVTMAGSALINGERPSALQVLSGFVVLAGLYIGFAAGGVGLRSISLAGVAWSMLSVAGLSGNALLSRKISAKADPLKQLFYSHLIGAVMLAAIRTFTEGWPDLSNMTPRIFLYMQYPAVFAALAGYGLLFSALRYISAPLASMICTMETVFAAALTPLIIGEVPPLHELAGCAVIAGAVVLSIFSERARGDA